VRRATDNVVAFAEGRADGSLRLRLVNLGINPIKKGDVFVTSGAGRLFRPAPRSPSRPRSPATARSRSC
jgi:rod shape-determining protein MreC